jgi:hypothetical protein
VGGPRVEGGPESDRAPGPVSAGIPAALLAEVVIAQVVSRPPGQVRLVGQVAPGQPGARGGHQFDGDAEVLIVGSEGDDGRGDPVEGRGDRTDGNRSDRPADLTPAGQQRRPRPGQVPGRCGRIPGRRGPVRAPGTQHRQRGPGVADDRGARGQRPGGHQGRGRSLEREMRIVEVVDRGDALPQVPDGRVLLGQRLGPGPDGGRRGGQFQPLPQQLDPLRVRGEPRVGLVLAMPVPAADPAAAGERGGRGRSPGVGDAQLPRPRGERVRVRLARLARLARRRLIKPEIGSDGRRVAGERDVMNGEPAARPVDDPLTGRHPQLADTRRRRLAADRIAVAVTFGQVVLIDDRPRGRHRDGVHRDQGRGGRGEDRAMRRPAGGAARFHPPLAEQPQVPLTVESSHDSMLAQQPGAAALRLA